MKYTLQQLEHLRDIRLKGFDKNEPLDDNHTNLYNDFKTNTDRFLNWLDKMEKDGKIEELLNEKL